MQEPTLRKPTKIAFSALLVLAVGFVCVSQPCWSQTQASLAGGDGGAFLFQAAPPSSADSLGDILYTPPGGSPVLLLHLKATGESSYQMQDAHQDARSHAVYSNLRQQNGNSLGISLAMANSAKGVRIALRSSGPGVVQLDAGDWDSALGVKNISVPYYTETVGYSPVLRRFVSAVWDLHQSQATSQKGRAVRYEARTDNTRLPLHEDLLITISDNIDDVLPAIGNPSSPLIQQLAGTMIIDVWDKNFSDISRGLNHLADYGLGNCIVIVHEWQNAGYDNGLPKHTPANAAEGGDAGLQAVSASATRAGCNFALHENYTDYYPNFPGFNQADLAQQQNGQPAPAWLNTSKVQSFVARPDRMAAIAARQSPAVHSLYNTSASFLDVNSALPPWRRGDRNVSAPYAASVQGWMTGSSALWSFERTNHSGPIFGEGGAHWFYSGLLDGVEAQFGFGPIATNLGENVPLFVDFDLLQIHPRQVNHGQGYFERWSTTKKASLTQDEMDAYRMQEIAFGHAPFVGRAVWADAFHAFEEQNLIGPVAARYGASSADSIRYDVSGQWLTPSGAAVANNFTQPEVTYQNGLTVFANEAPNAVTWHGINVPHHGWAAVGPDITAYTAECGRSVCSYAQTPVSLFANPRTPSDRPLSIGGLAAPNVQAAQVNGQNLVVQLGWSVNGTATSDLSEFIHIVDERPSAKNGGIVAQNDHNALPITNWKPGSKLVEPSISIPIPPSLSPGNYSVRVGLVAASNKARVTLSGNDDGSQRYTLGTLAISQSGTASFQPNATSVAASANFASIPQHIGIITTDGMISLRQIQGNWVLMPFSRDHTVTVSFDSAALAMPQQIMSETNGPIQPSSNGAHWTIQLNGSRSYSWPAVGQLPISAR